MHLNASKNTKLQHGPYGPRLTLNLVLATQGQLQEAAKVESYLSHKQTGL